MRSFIEFDWQAATAAGANNGALVFGGWDTASEPDRSRYAPCVLTVCEWEQ